MPEREPEVVADYRDHTGEGPIWHPDERRLYWVDIPDGELYRYDPATGDSEQVYETDVVGGYTLQADGSLLLFGAEGRIWTWDDGETETVVESIPGEEDSRFNDVVADPRGRVYCGTMPTDDRLGSLYRLETDGELVEVRDDVELPNGLGFTPDLRGLYFTESDAGTITLYEYDRETGELGDGEVFVDVSDEAGIPDGMTVDAGGHVWSARWDGGCLVEYSPGGEELSRVEFPARKVSSVVFGGEEYVDAYVTTALGPGEGSTSPREVEGEGAGALFRVDLGRRGMPEFHSRVNL